jgi:macrolide transport system ATP-binding/permease protein
MIGSTLQDLRFAVRQLRKSPGFAFTAVMVFALGIGAATAIFAFVDAVFIKPLPYRDPSRLVALYERIPVGDRYHLSYGDYLDWKRLNRSFNSLDVYRPDRFTLQTNSQAEEVSGASVSDGFFQTLGVVPFLGRDFRSGEDLPSAQQTVILSYEIWQKRFAANKNILSQTVTLNGVTSPIVGVLPPGFHFAPVASAGFWTTLGWLHEDDPRMAHPYYGVARLKPEISDATAYADLSSIAAQIAKQYPRSNRDRSATVVPLVNAILGDIRPTLIALLGGAGLLVLIGFVNVSSLLLVRAESRRRELAIRGALGAVRSRLGRQFAVEGFLLAACGMCVALVLAFCATRILPKQIPTSTLEKLPYLQQLHFDVHLFLFATIISIVGGFLFSAAPVLQLFLQDMQQGLLEGGRTAAGRSWRRVGAALVVLELAVTVVLLVSAGLLTKSFYRLMHEDMGISAAHLLVLHVVDDSASTTAQLLAREHEIIFRMAALPGVAAVGASEQIAVDSGEGFTHLFRHFRVVGRSYLGEGDEATERCASVGYFETLQARLLKGRFFTEADDASRTTVGIINQTMATQSFPGENPLGKRIVSEYDPHHLIQIVGVIDDIKEGPLDMKPTPAVYEPFNQDPVSNFYVTLRTSRSAATVLHTMVETVHRVDHGLIADGEETMSERIHDSQAAYLHRCAAWLVGGFAALALLLGTVGLYGMISYSVSQRTREIGVRMALGAQRSSVYKLILSEAGWLAALGVVAGVCVSIPLASLLRAMLFGVSPRDTGTIIAVTCILAAAAILASFLPARRAASIDPAEALRTD